MDATTKDRVLELLSGVMDPEVPVLSVVDLGVVRDVIEKDGGVEVVITPTYSGCPALIAMQKAVRDELVAAGYDPVSVRTTYTPAWTTDWLTDDAKRRLREYGIAPPGRTSEGERPVLCPFCGAAETHLESAFGSTACKALHVCDACRQPFEAFKCI